MCSLETYLLRISQRNADDIVSCVNVLNFLCPSPIHIETECIIDILFMYAVPVWIAYVAVDPPPQHTHTFLHLCCYCAQFYELHIVCVRK